MKKPKPTVTKTANISVLDDCRQIAIILIMSIMATGLFHRLKSRVQEPQPQFASFAPMASLSAPAQKLPEAAVQSPASAAPISLVSTGANRKNFEPLPPLPSRVKLEGGDHFKSMVSEAGRSTAAFAIQNTKISVGDSECEVPRGTAMQLIAQRGTNFYIGLLSAPCKISDSRSLVQGYFAVQDVGLGSVPSLKQ